jgi:hypothetical protein
VIVRHSADRTYVQRVCYFIGEKSVGRM